MWQPCIVAGKLLEMFEIIHFIIFFLTISINGVLLLGLARNPSLWTYLNGLLSIPLVCNIIHITIEFSFHVLKDETTSSSTLLHLCFMKHVGYRFHREITFMFLGSCVFFRFMMVTRGNDIRSGSQPLLPHQVV